MEMEMKMEMEMEMEIEKFQVFLCALGALTFGTSAVHQLGPRTG
jgi:hypothetical protein